jgi:hypothetical protein
MLASASVIAGVVYYAFQIRHQTITRQTDLVWRIARFLLKSFMQLETTMVNQQEREGGECSYQKASHEKPCETFQKTAGEGFP